MYKLRSRHICAQSVRVLIVLHLRSQVIGNWRRDLVIRECLVCYIMVV
jgi:hypothetical protein